MAAIGRLRGLFGFCAANGALQMPGFYAVGRRFFIITVMAER